MAQDEPRREDEREPGHGHEDEPEHEAEHGHEDEAGHEAEYEAGAEAPADAGSGGLPEADRAVLALERQSWPGPGAKERAVRERLGITPTRYYQLLNALLDDPRALAHDPVTVNRLRRLRDERRARR